MRGQVEELACVNDGEYLSNIMSEPWMMIQFEMLTEPIGLKRL